MLKILISRKLISNFLTEFINHLKKNPNNTLTYINVNSNHLPIVLQHINKPISSILSTNSINETIFNNAIPDYKDALRNSILNHNLLYNKKTK